MGNVSNTRLVAGNGTKGPLVNATVELFELDVNGRAIGGPLTFTQTDNDGNWQLEVNRSDPVLVRVSGGSYVDEADTNLSSRRVIELTDAQFLESVLMPGDSTVAVTVFTHALLEKSRRETGLNNFTDVLERNRALFTSAYGFDVLSILPANPLAPNGSPDAVAYALSAGGVANAINALSIASSTALPEYVHILTVVEDLVDCRLDGVSTGGQSVSATLPSEYTELTLEQQVLRFRNNNFAVYDGVTPRAIDAVQCDELGGVPDITAPQILAVAENVVFEAQSAEGVMLSAAQIDQLVAQFAAADDRQGELDWSLGVNTALPLGVSTLTAVVRDVWGNETSAEWQAMVVDTTPPAIVVPATVQADAVGTLTPVILAAPPASDQVTARNDIVLTNDAPALFPVGDTIVTWTARDGAGNEGTQTQRITVNSIPPVVEPAPAEIEIAANDVDFSQFFTDPDETALVFAASGLPPGTGLMLDPDTGVLGGTPTEADLAAQPITLIVTASDGQNSVSLEVVLNVTASNTPPAFTLSDAQLTLTEDFTPVVVQIEPAPVPDSEAGQMVSYSVAFSSQTASDEAPFDVVFDADALTLTLLPRADAFGDAVFALIADDGQAAFNEFSTTLVVSVTPVNDPPVLTGVNEPLSVAVGAPFDVDLRPRVTDVDDGSLVFSVERLPEAMQLNATGILTGVALPADALSASLPLIVTARDSAGLDATFTLMVQVSDPDSDGDGLSDYEESLLGFDPTNADSDDDGIGDSLEAQWPIDGIALFVSAQGDDAAAGDSPQTALATLSEASNRIAGISEAVVLVEKDAQVSGQLTLAQPSTAVLGGVDFATLQVAPTPSFSRVVDNSSLIDVRGCEDCFAANLRLERGAHMRIEDASVTLSRVHISGANSESSALTIRAADVTASQLHLATNRALRGGGLMLEAGADVTLSDALFIGNVAQSGGAVHMVDSALTLRNVVFSANAAIDAPIVDMISSSLIASNITVAYHVLSPTTGAGLVRCQTASLVACAPVQAPLIRDSVVASNRAASGGVVGLGDMAPASAAVFSDVDGVAPSLSSSAPFGVGYVGSDPVLVNAGIATAVDAGLEQYFSEVDSTFTDSGQVEPGVHARTPLRRIVAYRAQAVLVSEPSLLDLQAVDIRLFELTSNASVGSEHRVSVAVTSADSRAQAISTGVIVDDAQGAVPALSLGDGRYRVWLSDDVATGSDLLSVRLDDDLIGVEVLPQCDQVLCGITDVSVTATGPAVDDSISQEFAPASPDGMTRDGIN